MSNTRELYKGCASKAFFCFYHLFYVGHIIYKKTSTQLSKCVIYQNTYQVFSYPSSFRDIPGTLGLPRYTFGRQREKNQNIIYML